jgi:hypothetical protein
MGRKLLAAGVFLFGFPSLLLLTLVGYEAIANHFTAQLVGEDKFGTPTLNFLSGQGGLPVGVVAFAVAMFGLGVFDVAALFSDADAYRPGASDKILPRDHPIGYVFLRLRRYLLVPTLMALGYFFVFYLYHEPRPFVAPQFVTVPIALLVARRPLNWSLGSCLPFTWPDGREPR